MKGFGLIEILVASAIISGALVGLATTAQVAARSVTETARRAEARLLAQEAVEAVRTRRDAGWETYIEPKTIGTEYYPVFSTSTSAWLLATTSPGLIDGVYKRIVVFDNVYRDDSTNDIVPGGGSGTSLDSGTRRVTSRVVWGETNSEAVSYEGGTTDGDIAAFPSDNAGDGDPAQGVTIPAGDTVPLASVELLLKRVPGTTPSDIYLEVRSGGVTGAVVGTSNTVSASGLSDSGLVWVTFSFPTAPALTAGTKYYLRLRSTPSSSEPFSGSEGRIHWGYTQAAPSEYSGGTAWRYVGRNGNESYAGQQLADYDFAFRLNKKITGAKQVEFQTYLSDIFGN